MAQGEEAETRKRLSMIEDSLESLKDEYGKRLAEIHEKLDAALGSGRKVFEDRPLLSLGVAFALGLALGAILGRSKN